MPETTEAGLKADRAAESHYTDWHDNAGEFFEAWLREEPCHNSLKMWIGDDDKLCVQMCDFDGTSHIQAKNIDSAAHTWHQRKEPKR